MSFRYYEYFEIISLLAALLYARRLMHFRLLSLIPILLIACVADFLGVNSEAFGWQSNYFVYNYYLILTPPFYMQLFFRMLELKSSSKLVYMTIALLVQGLITINYFFFQGWNSFDTYSSLLLNFVYILLSCLTIFKVSLLDENFNIAPASAFFVISAGTLIFNLGILVILGLKNVIRVQRLNIYGKSLNGFLVPMLNVIMYGAYTFAIVLCRNRNRK